MRPVKFKATLDRLTVIISLSCFVLFAGISLMVLWLPDLPWYAAMGIIVFNFSVFIICYALHPETYEVNDEAVCIHSPWRTYRYPLTEIEKVRLLDEKEMKGAIRTFGVGGLFGYYGKFYNRQIGSMTWYASQRKNWVLVQTKKGCKIILTPDVPEALLRTLSAFAV